jgi:intracellular sulfur oxidation DsrE/DsrF family protein
MKKITMILCFGLVCVIPKAFSQTTNNPKSFHGAVASLKSYKALYVLNESSEKKIKGVIRNINNSLDDPRLKGKLQVELVVFGDGVEVFKKSNHYDTLLLALQKRGVILAQCENTIEERKISKDGLWPFISYVPSGNGEIIIRQYQGWAIVHP